MRDTTGRPVERVTPAQPVIIVGAGMAGLTAAWELRKRGIPARVIERAPRAGGRVHTVSEHQGLLETGMQFYYSAYKETFRLLREFGLRKTLVPIPVRGLMSWDGRIRTFSKTRPWLGLLSVGENLKLIASVARKLFQLIRMSPFGHRAEERLDQIDVADYFGGAGSDAILEVAIRPMVNSYAFCEPEGHSLATLLRIVKLGALAKTYGLRGGNDSLARAMAAKLDVVHGDVSEIVIDDGTVKGVVIERGGRREMQPSSCVVSAVSAVCAERLVPAAPRLASALGALDYSSIILANLHLDRALTGKDWVYVLSRRSGHRAAFGIDLMRRAPAMFPGGNSVLQVDFASPVSDRLMAHSDDEIAAIAIDDMATFLPDLAQSVTHTSVVRRPRAHPTFARGAFQAIKAVQAEAARVPGLYLAGDYLRAPLCEGAVRSAQACVQRITE